MKFTDGTTLFRKTKETGDKKIQDGIDKLVRWSEKWQMLFNFGKSKCMHTGPGNTGMNYGMGGTCSPCSPWWPFPYLVGVGLVLLLHSFRSRTTSWVTPTPAMSSFVCWCHVFVGRPRRLVPGIASSITLHVTLVAYRLWTCPNQRRRPLRITSSIIIISTTGGSRLQRSHMVQISCSM